MTDAEKIRVLREALEKARLYVEYFEKEGALFVAGQVRAQQVLKSVDAALAATGGEA